MNQSEILRDRIIICLIDVNVVCLYVVTQDGSTMLMEAAKGGHFDTMTLLLDWPASSAANHAAPVAALTDVASHDNKVLASADCTVDCIQLT